MYLLLKAYLGNNLYNLTRRSVNYFDRLFNFYNLAYLYNKQNKNILWHIKLVYTIKLFNEIKF